MMIYPDVILIKDWGSPTTHKYNHDSTSKKPCDMCPPGHASIRCYHYAKKLITDPETKYDPGGQPYDEKPQQDPDWCARM